VLKEKDRRSEDRIVLRGVWAQLVSAVIALCKADVASFHSGRYRTTYMYHDAFDAKIDGEL
jgi:hypothetical protein